MAKPSTEPGGHLPGVGLGELDPGAGALDVGVVEELGVGQGDRGAGDVGVGAALGVGEVASEGGVAGVLGGAGEAQW